MNFAFIIFLLRIKLWFLKVLSNQTLRPTAIITYRLSNLSSNSFHYLLGIYTDWILPSSNDRSCLRYWLNSDIHYLARPLDVIQGPPPPISCGYFLLKLNMYIHSHAPYTPPQFLRVALSLSNSRKPYIIGSQCGALVIIDQRVPAQPHHTKVAELNLNLCMSLQVNIITRAPYRHKFCLSQVPMIQISATCHYNTFYSPLSRVRPCTVAVNYHTYFTMTHLSTIMKLLSCGQITAQIQYFYYIFARVLSSDYSYF